MTITPLGSTSVAAGDVALASQYNSILLDIPGYTWAKCGRLTLGTSAPVTTTDISAATTIYYTPYMGNTFNTFHTSATYRDVYTFDEISLSLNTTDHPANTNFDMFVYHLSTSTDATYMSLVSIAWTTDLTRAAELTDTQGTYTRTGFNPGFYKFVGSFRTVAAGQTEDSVTKRFLANYYNAVPKNMYVEETTQNTSTTDTKALWNGSVTNNQLGFIVCQPYGYSIPCTISAKSKANADGQYARVTLYVDGAITSAPINDVVNFNDQNLQLGATHPNHFATGYHYLNTYIDGTDGGIATFDDLRMSAMVWV